MLNQAWKSDYVGPFSGEVSGLISEIKPAVYFVADMVADTVVILDRRMTTGVDTG